MAFDLARNEDLRHGYNCTQEQATYMALWAGRGGFQRGREDMPYLGVVFKPRPKRLPTGRSEVVPLREGQLVRSLDSVEAAVISRIPANRWKGHRGNARWRLNLLRLGFAEVDGAVEARAPRGHFDQFDLEKWPIQDHPVLEEVHWSPDQLIATANELTAPAAGIVELQRTQLYVDVAVARKPFVRLPLQHVELLVKSNDIVQEGQSIARFDGAVQYGRFRLNAQGRPVMDRIGGDVLSATRHAHLLGAANLCLAQMQAGEPSGMAEEVMPRVVALFSPAQFERMLHDPAWQVTPALERVILAGLAPGGDLTVEGVVKRVYSSVQELDESSRYLATKAALARLATDAKDAGLTVPGQLLEAGYVPYSLPHAGLYLDFTPCKEFLHEESGTISLCLPHAEWDEFLLVAGGAAYDFTPQGDRLTVPQPKPAAGSRRRRRRPRRKATTTN